MTAGLAGSPPSAWLEQHLGGELAQTKVGELGVATYPEDAETGLGNYVEIVNPAFIDTPAPQRRSVPGSRPAGRARATGWCDRS